MKNLIGLWVNVSRAYEIALLGNYSIEVVFDKSYKEGFEDYQAIKEFFNEVPFKIGGLQVEITKPDYQQNSQCEDKSDILDRVNAAKKRELPTAFKSSGCEHLLKVASERLSLSLPKIESIKSVAAVIAQLSGSKEIAVEHIAEAIHYHSYNGEGILAEANQMRFGGITIPLTEQSEADVKLAVEYLQTLLNNS